MIDRHIMQKKEWSRSPHSMKLATMAVSVSITFT